MALKPCKECKQEVSTKAKACPHCGAKHPTVSGKDTALGCLSVIIIIIIITVALNSCSDESDKSPEPTPTTQTTKPKVSQSQNNAIILNDANTNAVLVNAINLYTQNFKLLIQRYSAYKDRDKSVFILWRNNEWLPAYEAKTKEFDDILDKNRSYIFSHGLISAFSSLKNLELISLDIMRAIRDSAPSNLDKARAASKRDLTNLYKIIKDRNLESKLDPMN